MDLEEFLTDVGKTALCSRCGEMCKVAASRKKDARIMKKAARPHGYCVNCAATLWLRTIEPLPTILRDKGPHVLLHDMVQVQVGAVLRTANADCDPSDIDWRRVVATWDLPVTSEMATRRGREGKTT